MEGLENHKYASGRLEESSDAASPVGSAVQRIVRLMQTSRNEEANAAYAEEVEKLSAEGNFDIEAFHERLGNEGYAIQAPPARPTDQERAPAVSNQENSPKPKRAERQQAAYSEDHRENAKDNLRKYVERLNLPSDEAEVFNKRIDAVQAPEDTIALVRELGDIEGKRPQAQPKKQETPPPIPPVPPAEPPAAAGSADAVPPSLEMKKDDFRAKNGGGSGNEPPTNGTGTTGPERDPQGVGKIAVEVPGQFVSWRDPNPLRYDGIPLKNTRDILANPRDAQLFGELLQAIGGEQNDEVLERFERYKNGAASKEDMDFVTYATKEFSRSMKFAEDAVGQIGIKDVELFSRRNSDLEDVLVQDNPQRAGEIIKNSVFHMAMCKPEETANLVKNLRNLKENQSSPFFQKWNTEVNELCKAAGIQNVQSFDAMYNMEAGERTATRERVRERVRENMNVFEKSLDFAAAGFGLSKTDRLMKRADWVARMKQKTFLRPTSWSVSGVDKGLGDIARFLGETVANDEIRFVVAKEVIENRNFDLASERGPKSFTQLQEATRESSITSNLEARIRNEGDNWNQGEAYQNQRLSEWKKEEERKQGGTGFWAWLFSSLFGREFNKVATKKVGRKIEV